MTTFGMDDSHYGQPLQARDGLDFYTHKLTDGDHFYEDAEYQAGMVAARDLIIPVLGPYHVLHGGVSVDAQALWFVQRADRWTPWWRDWDPDAWIWQIDSEPFSYLRRPSIDEVNAFGDAILRLTGSPHDSVNGYCPAWAYSDAELRRLRFPWWPSNYGSNPAVPYRQAYPGDNSTRWAGPIPARFLQYGSRTIIAGQPTSDANAYRGTLAQLRAAIASGGTGVSTMSQFQIQKPDGTLDPRVWTTDEGLRKRQMPNTIARDGLLKVTGQAKVVVLPLPNGYTIEQYATEVGGPDDVVCACNDNGGGGTCTCSIPPAELTKVQAAAHAGASEGAQSILGAATVQSTVDVRFGS